MGKRFIHASAFIFHRMIIKVAGNQDRHKSSVEFDFRQNQITHLDFWSYLPLSDENFTAHLDKILCVASLG